MSKGTIQTVQNWPELMDVDTAASYWSLSTRSFQRLVSAGVIKGRKLGPRVIRYSRTEMDAAAMEFPHGKGDSPRE